MISCYLGLGSNLRSPERQIRQALVALRKLPKTILTHQSGLYFSKPCGVRMQPMYCNMVALIQTTLTPATLLLYCQQIEKNHQRSRKKHWGARTIDIDVLLYGQQIINQPHLTIPHPRMMQRDFVLIPMTDISPKAELPQGRRLSSFLKDCPSHVLKTDNRGNRYL